MQQEMRSAGWNSSVMGGIACKQWGVVDNQEGSEQLHALKEVLVLLCRDESSEGGRWARQETLAMD